MKMILLFLFFSGTAKGDFIDPNSISTFLTKYKNSKSFSAFMNDNKSNFTPQLYSFINDKASAHLSKPLPPIIQKSQYELTIGEGRDTINLTILNFNDKTLYFKIGFQTFSYNLSESPLDWWKNIMNTSLEKSAGLYFLFNSAHANYIKLSLLAITVGIPIITAGIMTIVYRMVNAENIKNTNQCNTLKPDIESTCQKMLTLSERKDVSKEGKYQISEFQKMTDSVYISCLKLNTAFSGQFGEIKKCSDKIKINMANLYPNENLQEIPGQNKISN